MGDPGLSRTALTGAALVAILTLLCALVGLEIVDGGGGQSSPPAGVELVDGVPLGVQHTRAGALAAADNYLAASSQTVEQDPSVFAQLVAHVYAPGIRARTISEAQRVRAQDSRDMANYAEGGRGIAVVATHRLDSYSPQTATITSWLGGFVWGPHVTPSQSWNLVDTTLRWQSGRWLVVSSSTDPTPAPTPAIVYVQGTNDQAGAFARLAGMSAPSYGAGG